MKSNSDSENESVMDQPKIWKPLLPKGQLHIRKRNQRLNVKLKPTKPKVKRLHKTRHSNWSHSPHGAPQRQRKRHTNFDDFSDKIDTKYAGPLTYTYLNTDQVSKSSNNEFFFTPPSERKLLDKGDKLIFFPKSLSHNAISKQNSDEFRPRISSTSSICNRPSSIAETITLIAQQHGKLGEIKVHLYICELIKILGNTSMPSSLIESIVFFTPPNSRKTPDDMLSLPSISYSQNDTCVGSMLILKQIPEELIARISSDPASVCDRALSVAETTILMIQPQHGKLGDTEVVHPNICELIKILENTSMPSSLIEKTEVHLNNCELEILVNSSMPSSLKETVFAPPSSRKTLDKRDVLSLPSKSYSQNVSKLSSAESISMVSLDLALSSGVCNMSVNAALDKNSNIQQHAKLSGVESQRVHFKICGLINLGNTCYMNSALQCLVHTEPLRELIEPTDKNESRTLHTSQPSDRRPLASSFSHLIKDMLQAPSLGYCDPCALKKAIESHAPIFKGNSQQDAQELITFFIGGLHEEFNEITGKKPYVTMEVDESQFESEEEIADEWRKLSEKRDKSEIIKIFYGRTKCTMKCQNPSCGHELRMYEPVFPLTLPIPQKSDVSLKDCLKFYTEEKISTDPWYCEECNEEVTFSRKVEMWNMPQILMVYLKRFSFKRGIYTKIYNHVKFDLLFPLKDICPREKEKYQLYAVINHSGSLQSGHYYAFVKCQDKWHECNDFICNEISEDDVITSSAYVLFYERVKVKESEE